MCLTRFRRQQVLSEAKELLDRVTSRLARAVKMNRLHETSCAERHDDRLNSSYGKIR